MINWFDMPAEGLSNGGLFEVKELNVTENGTYEQSGEMYNKVTVNVEGGGGSSDFSTAEVTIIPIIEGSPTLVTNVFGAEIQYPEGSSSPYYANFNDFNGNVILYKNEAIIPIDSIGGEGSNGIYYGASDNPAPTISGNATFDIDEGIFTITGDCTITVTMVQTNYCDIS